MPQGDILTQLLWLRGEALKQVTRVEWKKLYDGTYWFYNNHLFALFNKCKWQLNATELQRPTTN